MTEYYGNNDFRTYHLAHHGIKGMKWGVRRYQNPDGSLTDAGRKRYLNDDGSLNEKGKTHISSIYKKSAVAAAKNYESKRSKVYLESYNKAVEEMNSGLIEKFNSDQEKKYGKDFSSRQGYVDDYEKIFDNTLQKHLNKRVIDVFESDKNYQFSMALIEKYGMQNWDDLAKQNFEVMNDLKKRLNN